VWHRLISSNHQVLMAKPSYRRNKRARRVRSTANERQARDDGSSSGFGRSRLIATSSGGRRARGVFGAEVVTALRAGAVGSPVTVCGHRLHPGNVFAAMNVCLLDMHLHPQLGRWAGARRWRKVADRAAHLVVVDNAGGAVDVQPDQVARVPIRTVVNKAVLPPMCPSASRRVRPGKPKRTDASPRRNGPHSASRMSLSVDAVAHQLVVATTYWRGLNPRCGVVGPVMPAIGFQGAGPVRRAATAGGSSSN
jgi:hypothetical protein